MLHNPLSSPCVAKREITTQLENGYIWRNFFNLLKLCALSSLNHKSTCLLFIRISWRSHHTNPVQDYSKLTGSEQSQFKREKHVPRISIIDFPFLLWLATRLPSSDFSVSWAICFIGSRLKFVFVSKCSKNDVCCSPNSRTSRIRS